MTTTTTAFDADADVRVTFLDVGGNRLAIMSVPCALRIDRLAGLTPAERQVVAGVLAGLSNLEIARARKSSPRTVANQIASIFGKLGVGSRGELMATLWCAQEDAR